MTGSLHAPSVRGAAEDGRERRARIALVISAMHLGGAERVVCRLAEFWANAGHEVTVVTVASRERDVYVLPEGVGRVALDLARPSRHWTQAIAGGARRVVALRRALLALRPDVVISFLESTNVLSLLAMTGTDVPVFACVRTDPRFAPLGRAWSGLRRLLYPRARGVVVQTEGVASWARAFCRSVHVIPNSVERPDRCASPGAEEGPKRLVAMGRLSPEKGFDLLLRAFARVAGAHPGWSLTILGDGPDRQRLERVSSSLGLVGRVALPGRVDDPLPYLVAAHAFALPSLYEGFPNALLEAMAAGLPAVAFDCPSGPAEVVAHERNGLLVPAGDVEALADALEQLMSHPAERARLGARAREIAEVLAPERVLPRWSQLLPPTCGERSPGATP